MYEKGRARGTQRLEGVRGLVDGLTEKAWDRAGALVYRFGFACTGQV